MSTRCRVLGLLLVALLLVVGCGRPEATVPPATVAAATALATAPVLTPQPGTAGLSPDEISTLQSLEKVDGYPLYTMRYYGPYMEAGSVGDIIAAPKAPGMAAAPAGFESVRGQSSPHSGAPTWACSLFAALGDPQARLYGRNFDWEPSPALLLFTAPPDGYASVSMVDIAYLGFPKGEAAWVATLPLGERRSLLDAPSLPFDGMNDQGLAIGMAAVPPGDVQPDPRKETIGSIQVIREVLDHARDADEALAILERYNVETQGSTPVHYLVADRSGRALLIEFYQGEMRVFPNENPWHLATNFLRAAADSPAGQCWRYDAINQRLLQVRGQVTAAQAMDLLAKVAQPGTQWSVVYHLSTGQIDVAMGQHYRDRHTFTLGK